ncbi:MAG: DUF86 domain-containing protein [Candidatus Methylomirabilales bacterium]
MPPSTSFRQPWRRSPTSATILIAALSLRRPTERTEVPAILAENGIIPEALAVKLQQAIGLRNVMLLETVYVVIQEHLGDIEAFARQS